MTTVSLLAWIFGVCQCRGVFDCKTPVDSYGGVLLWLGLLAYMLKALNVICNVYLVPSLESLVDRLNISNDVASVTFIAFGSSAPRIFVSFTATFLIPNTSGLGVIVGSGIFNILIIVGLTGFVACKEHSMKIWWYPLLRDTAFYSLAIFEVLLILADEVIQWQEGLAILLTYLVYCTYMRFSNRVATRLGLVRALAGAQSATASIPVGAAVGAAEEGAAEDAAGPAEVTLRRGPGPGPSEPAAAKEEGPLPLRDPLELLLEAAMPSAEGHGWLLLGLSSLCVAVAAYVMVDCATRSAQILRLPPAVMGLTFLAIATSVPEAHSAIAVAKQGEGDMAVVNALGTSIFDIGVGLGVPWLLRGMLTIEGELPYFKWDLLLLLLFLILFLSILVYARHRLTRRGGVLLMALYALYCFYNFVGVLSFRALEDE